MSKYVIFIGGPTASGKTSMSIALAKHYDCDIISADSRQFYKEISIGTAKPTKAEMSGVAHHLIDSLHIDQDYSAGQFERDGLSLIGKLHKTHDIVIVVGGTGLYHRAVYAGLDQFPKVPKEIIHEYARDHELSGIVKLQTELRQLDPEYAQVVDLSNPQRLIRALSVIKASGNTYSSYLNKGADNRSFKAIRIAIQVDRAMLYERINNRVDHMISNGLIDEARSVYPYRHLNSLNTVGYKELFEHFDGNWSLAMAIDKIKQHTRNYAKRQITWFNNQDDWTKVRNLTKAREIIAENLAHC